MYFRKLSSYVNIEFILMNLFKICQWKRSCMVSGKLYRPSSFKYNDLGYYIPMWLANSYYYKHPRTSEILHIALKYK